MKKGKAPYISQEAFERTLNAQGGSHALRDQTILCCSYLLGLRAMELANLRVGDVFDLNTGEIRSIARLMPSMTKNEVFREVYLKNAKLRDHLRRYLITRPARAEAPLFLSQKGGGFTANTMQKLLHNIYAKARIAASSHSGRRSFATNLNDKGADVNSIRVMMGHAWINTTQEYIDTSPLRLERFAEML